MKVHHIGYLVSDMSEAIDTFQVLGYDICQDVMHDGSRGGDFCFLKNEGTVVELIAPEEGCKEYRSLSKRIGNAPYHICYVADNFEGDAMRLEKTGWLQIKPASVAPAIDGRRVAFFYHEAIGIIELLE